MDVEESKEKQINRIGSTQNSKSAGVEHKLSEEKVKQKSYLLKEDKDEDKYTFKSSMSNYKPSIYETKQIFSLGLDLNDAKK